MPRKPKVENLEGILGNAGGVKTPEPELAEKPIQPEPEKRSYPSREDKKPVQVFINTKAHTQLRIAGFEREMSNQDILTEALNAWFTINNLPPIA